MSHLKRILFGGAKRLLQQTDVKSNMCQPLAQVAWAKDIPPQLPIFNKNDTRPIEPKIYSTPILNKSTVENRCSQSKTCYPTAIKSTQKQQENLDAFLRKDIPILEKLNQIQLRSSTASIPEKNRKGKKRSFKFSNEIDDDSYFDELKQPSLKRQRIYSTIVNKNTNTHIDTTQTKQRLPHPAPQTITKQQGNHSNTTINHASYTSKKSITRTMITHQPKLVQKLHKRPRNILSYDKCLKSIKSPGESQYGREID